jgi:alcohol dehydrogenase class IV
MTDFTFTQFPQTISISDGDAGARLSDELVRRDQPRVLLIGTGRALMSIEPAPASAARITAVRRHVPAEDAEQARQVARSSGAELIVCVGGGSATGLAKAVALTEHLPIIAVPTTYAGSEATPVWGITQEQRKQTGVDPIVLPETIIYDTRMLAALPRRLAVASALNALAHGIDALWAPAANPITSTHAEGGIRWIHDALSGIDDQPAVDTASQLLVGTYLTSTAFASAGSGMHHKICHVLGGTYDLPHADLHAVILPHVVAFNMPDAPAAGAALRRALGGEDVIGALAQIYWTLKAPRSLAEIGFDISHLDKAAELCAAAIPPSNPRRVTVAAIRELLFAAYKGTLTQRSNS